MDEIELLRTQFNEFKQSVETQEKQHRGEVESLKTENKRQADELSQLLAEKKITEIKLAAQDAVSKNKEHLDPDKLAEAANAFEKLIPLGQEAVDAAITLVACKKQPALPKFTSNLPVIELGRVGPQIKAEHDQLEATRVGNSGGAVSTVTERERYAQSLLGGGWGVNR